MLQFVRATSIQLVRQETLSSRRGFLFHVAAGFSKPVDPLTGMSANLNLIDQWLHQVPLKFSQWSVQGGDENLNDSLELWGLQIRSFLENCAKGDGTSLESLSFREERGWSFSWQKSSSSDSFLFTSSHFVESLPLEGPCDLLKIHFTWRRSLGCGLDYHSEGLKVLKGLSGADAHSVLEGLRHVVGLKLATGTSLQSVRLEHLGQNYSLELP